MRRVDPERVVGVLGRVRGEGDGERSRRDRHAIVEQVQLRWDVERQRTRDAKCDQLGRRDGRRRVGERDGPRPRLLGRRDRHGRGRTGGQRQPCRQRGAGDARLGQRDRHRVHRQHGAGHALHRPGVGAAAADRQDRSVDRDASGAHVDRHRMAGHRLDEPAERRTQAGIGAVQCERISETVEVLLDGREIGHRRRRRGLPRVPDRRPDVTRRGGVPGAIRSRATIPWSRWWCQAGDALSVTRLKTGPVRPCPLKSRING